MATTSDFNDIAQGYAIEAVNIAAKHFRDTGLGDKLAKNLEARGFNALSEKLTDAIGAKQFLRHKNDMDDDHTNTSGGFVEERTLAKEFIDYVFASVNNGATQLNLLAFNGCDSNEEAFQMLCDSQALVEDNINNLQILFTGQSDIATALISHHEELNVHLKNAISLLKEYVSVEEMQKLDVARVERVGKLPAGFIFNLEPIPGE